MKKLFAPFILLLAFLIKAQTVSGSILAKDGRQPIPYAKIAIDDQSSGAIADELGNFTINLDDIALNSNVKIEVGGFEKYSVLVKDFAKTDKKQILLEEKVKAIEEVKIIYKNFTQENWGVTTKNKRRKFLHNASKEEGNQSRELAVLFENENEVKLQKININIASFKTDRPVFVRFTIYDKNLHLILEEDLYDKISANKIIKNVYSYDVSNKQIWLTDDFYIGIQLLNYFEGNFSISGAKTGNKTIYRHYLSNWIEVPVIKPAINIIVKVAKN